MHGMQVSIEMTVRYILVYHKCLSVHSKFQRQYYEIIEDVLLD